MSLSANEIHPQSFSNTGSWPIRAKWGNFGTLSNFLHIQNGIASVRSKGPSRKYVTL